MRFPISQDTVRKKALNMMTHYSILRYNAPNKKERDVLTNYVSGMELMARQMGVDCTCRLTGVKGEPLCSCKILPQPGDRGLKLKTYTPRARRR